MKAKCWMVIHKERFTEDLYRKIFDSEFLANHYIKELTEITDEAEWVETRVLDIYTTDSTIMTPVQENIYWDSIYNFHKNYDHGAEL